MQPAMHSASQPATRYMLFNVPAISRGNLSFLLHSCFHYLSQQSKPKISLNFLSKEKSISSSFHKSYEYYKKFLRTPFISLTKQVEEVSCRSFKVYADARLSNMNTYETWTWKKPILYKEKYFVGSICEKINESCVRYCSHNRENTLA